MRCLRLADALVVSKYKYRIRLTEDRYVDLENETCHILFSTKKVRNEVVAQFSSPTVAVIPCDGYTNYGSAAVLKTPMTFAQLMTGLGDILAGKLISDVVLDTLIVDNLSIFFWDIRVADKSNYRDMGFDHHVSASQRYLRLYEILDSIRSKYRCNVIVTSYDINTDKGYFSAYKDVDLTCQPGDKETTQRASYLPHQYLCSFDHLVHCSARGSQKYDKSTNHWY